MAVDNASARSIQNKIQDRNFFCGRMLWRAQKREEDSSKNDKERCFSRVCCCCCCRLYWLYCIEHIACQVFLIRPRTVPSPTRLCRHLKSIALKVKTVAYPNILRCTFLTLKHELCWPTWHPRHLDSLSTWDRLLVSLEFRQDRMKIQRHTAGNLVEGRLTTTTTWSQSMKHQTTKRPGGTVMEAEALLLPAAVTCFSEVLPSFHQ